MDPLTWYVMDATADDWESLEQILPHVRACHGPIEPSALAVIIAHLIREGLMEEMQHPIIDPAVVVADPIEFWFRMTQRGRKLWDSEGTNFRHDVEK
jgi:hypothetical protein